VGWTVEEKKSDLETVLNVYKDGKIKGVIDVTLYANGPCVKYLTAITSEDGPAMVQIATQYLQEHYGYPYGVFAYVYDYKEYEKDWLEKADFKFFRNMDEGKRLMFKLEPPLVN
jgi:hypothetical protein